MSDVHETLVVPLIEFAKDSKLLIDKCTKPTREEFFATCRATGMGIIVMGFIGFVVKLMHIPIKDILDS
jgi:protein transport protein SEC61 subunit gamma and related proteins